MPQTTHDEGLEFLKRALGNPQPLSKLFDGTRPTEPVVAESEGRQFLKRACANPRPLSEMYSGTRRK